MREKIYVMDTTLRDGEQTPSVSFSPQQKVSIANALYDIGVDYIEVGSAKVSKGEKEAMKSVVKSFREKSYPVENLECLALMTKDSIDWANETGIETVNVLSKGSKKQLVQLAKLGIATPQEHTSRLLELIDYTQDCGMKRPNVYLEHISSKGGYFDNPDYVQDLFDNILKSGKVKRITACDTLGQLSPTKTKEMMGDLVKKYPTAFIDFHGHNDYGTATGNTIAAVEAGCKGVQVTVNGMGERSGNAALHEVVLGIRDFTGKKTNVDEKKLYSLSKIVSNLSGVPIAPSMPVVGENAHKHNCGVHTDGMLKDKLYEGMITPQRIGKEDYSYALGKHSGSATIEKYLREMGEVPTGNLVSKVLEKVKDLSDENKIVTSNDLAFIVEDVIGEPKNKRAEIIYSFASTGIGTIPEAIVNVRVDDRQYSDIANGNGGFNASMKALTKALEPLKLDMPKLKNYSASIPPIEDHDGTSSMVRVVITWEDKSGKRFKTTGADHDNTKAALKAAEKMINKVLNGASSESTHQE